MGDEEQLEELRRRRLAEIQQQAMQQEVAQQQQETFEKQKYLIMRKILTQEARQRLENIRMVKSQFAEQIELQLIQLFQSGRLRGATPLPDEAFKKLLEQLSQTGKKKEFKIKNI
jgi:programmed cell death protein 5